MSRSSRRARALLLAAAGWAGAAARSVPGAAGGLALSYGAWSIYRPAGYIVAGVLLLLIDRRMPR